MTLVGLVNGTGYERTSKNVTISGVTQHLDFEGPMTTFGLRRTHDTCTVGSTLIPSQAGCSGRRTITIMYTHSTECDFGSDDED